MASYPVVNKGSVAGGQDEVP